MRVAGPAYRPNPVRPGSGPRSVTPGSGPRSLLRLDTKLSLYRLPIYREPNYQWPADAAAVMREAACSPIIMAGAFVLPPGMLGMIEASATRRPSMPRTRGPGSTTARLGGA